MLVLIVSSDNVIRYAFKESKSVSFRGWSGGAMVLDKLPVQGCPTYLE